jgi:hypothetical protein
VFDNGEWKIKRTVTLKGYDAVLGTWTVLDVSEHFEPLSSDGLYKEIVQTIYIKRSAYDALLKPIEAYVKLIRKVEVENKTNNIYLKESCNRLFVTDFTRTTPVQLNQLNQGLKATVLKEEKLSPEELQKLMQDLANPKVVFKPVIVEELQSGELRLLA